MLNKQQSEAMSQILAWFENANLTGRQVYTLGGYAGTGKTFLINQVVEALNLKDHEVAFATYTGKAASVIIQRGTDASTIHRLIYTAVDEDYETEMNGEKIKSHRIKFVKKESIPSYKLIVIDEISMVDEKTMKDLLSFGIPLLATGDPGQLPPIQGENPLIKNPNYFLTEIVRQAEDNAIIKIATMARNGEPIPYGNYGDVIVLDRRAITLNIQKKLLLKADQVICGTNATRIYLNNEIRKMKDIDIIESKYPLDGEKVIWSVNNWELWLDSEMEYNLVNGTMGTVSNVEVKDPILNLGRTSFTPDFIDESTDDMLFDSGVFLNDEYTYDMHQRALILPDGKFRIKKYFGKRADEEPFEDFQKRIMSVVKDMRDALDEEMINRMDFGYAITVHKSQGSEWDRVVVYDESHIFGESALKWAYTAFTRAKKKLVIIR